MSVKDISNGNVSFANCKFISEAEHKLLYSRCDPQNGDILLSKVGTTGIPVLVDTDVQFSLFVSVALLRIFNECVYNKYILNAMLSPFSQMQVEDNTRGVGNKNWVMRDIAHTLISLPPLAEQKRIVAKIEKLMSLVEEYGKMEESRLQLDADLPATLEKSILQEAIQGKLVPQDPNDEPASELLKRIAAERKALVKAGKLKRDKVESVIFRGSDRLAYETRNGETVCIQDEIPFEIPDSWEWVRLGDILHPMTSKKPTGEKFDYIDIDAIDNKQYIVKAAKTLQTKGATSRASREVKSGDVLFSMVRPYLRNIALIDEGYAHCIASTGFYVCRPSDVLYPPYLYHLMLSDYVVMGLNESMKGLNSPGITTGDLQRFPIPLPPLAEQKRIVAKIEDLRAVIKSLTT